MVRPNNPYSQPAFHKIYYGDEEGSGKNMLVVTDAAY